jgi:GAF domain-containing protein
MSRKPAKTQHANTMKPKRNHTPTVARPASSTLADLQEQVSALTRELSEALEQQTATSEILGVIAASPTNIQPVLEAIAENACRLCKAYDSVIFLCEGERLRARAHHGPISTLGEGPIERNWVTGRAFVDREPVHVHDLQGAADEFPNGSQRALRLGHRTTLGIPLLREDEAIGTLLIRRAEVRPFTHKQIALLTTFARQAVIAIENVRLFDDVQQRTRELSESLQQQTATADVLQVISTSPGELEPVFQAMLENAVHICEAKFGILFRHDGQAFELAAELDTPPEFAEFQRRRGPFQPIPGGHLDRILRTKQVSHTDDNAADAIVGVSASLGGARSAVGVPMIKDDVVIGVIFIYRQEVRPFTNKQIELLQNFAAQAVIAIENTRLLNELRESLQQQTATADVLKVISSLPGELGPVFQAMLENATRICEAKFGTLFRFDGERYHLAAQVGTPPELVEAQKRRGPFKPKPGVPLEKIIRTKQLSHLADVSSLSILGARLGGARTLITVPMLKDDELVGAIAIYRQEIKPFTDKQIELVQNFAAQAVIAIENTRLLNELRESLQQQTATADVLKVISRSTFDLQAVPHWFSRPHGYARRIL